MTKKLDKLERLQRLLNNLGIGGSENDTIQYVPVENIDNISICLDNLGVMDIDLVWVDAKSLERIWKKDSLNYVEKWQGNPKAVWFMDRKTPNGIRTPLIAVTFDGGEPSISFSQGRHRARWMMSNQRLNRIPVGMHKDMIDRASDIGLVVGHVLETDGLADGRND